MKDKKIQNFYNVIFNKKWKKVLLMFIGIILLNSLISVTTDFNALGNLAKIFYAGPEDEVRSVEILSDKDQGPSSFKVTKSAKWIKNNQAEITFKISSKLKVEDDPKDIILVLDTSESMLAEKNNKSKLQQVKSDASALATAVLSKDNNRIALVEFNSSATIRSDFTNDASKINNLINSFTAFEATNYKEALVKVQDVLKGACDICSGSPYVPSEDRDLVILFLSDGYPVVDTPYEIGEYEKIKNAYPNIIVNAIQYELGDKIAQELIDISDHQYVSYIGNLKNVLYAASTAIKFYEKLDITDLIDTDSFEIKSADDIKVSDGTIQFDEETQKIIWQLSEYNESLEQYTFMTSHSAEMKIKIYLKEDLKNLTGLYPTNKKEIINYKLEEELEQNITEPKVPKLYNGYTLTYDYNLPNECRDSYKTTEESEIKSILEEIDTTKKEAPICDSYQFQGWVPIAGDERYINGENDEEINYKINDTSFKMPWKDIRLMGVWTKFGITKSIEGKVYDDEPVPLINRIKESGYDELIGGIPIDNVSSKYVENELGIDFATKSSLTNGNGVYIRAGTEEGAENYNGNPIYYYRGNVNNNLIFAGFCWKIVRTTETGGIKLIYNGSPKDNQCLNTEETSFSSKLTIIDSSDFNYPANSIAYNGYMYGNVYETKETLMHSYGLVFAKWGVNGDKKYYFTKKPPEIVDNDIILNVDDSESLYGTWGEVKDKISAGGGYYTCFVDKGEKCGYDSVKYLVDTYEYNNKYYAYATILKIYWSDETDSRAVEKLEDKEYIMLGSEVETLEEKDKNGKVQYRLSGNVKRILKTDWSKNYKDYKGWYACVSNSNSYFIDTDTCSEGDMSYITSTEGWYFHRSIVREMVFANDVSYDKTTGLYTLIDTIVKTTDDNWVDSISKKKYTKRHYACLGKETQCEKVYYVYGMRKEQGRYLFYDTFYPTYGYISYIELNGTENVNTALEEMFSNENDSKVKTVIDEWYRKNIDYKGYTRMLEDAIWCNDRSILNQEDYGGWNKDNDSGGLKYGSYKRLSSYTSFGVNPILIDDRACPNKNDQFTVINSARGNNKLIHSVGLLTSDEIIAAGNKYGLIHADNTTPSYLYNSYYYWTMTPASFYSDAQNGYANGLASSSTAVDTRYNYGSYSLGVRPAISLKSDTKVYGLGDGTNAHPYIVQVPDLEEEKTEEIKNLKSLMLENESPELDNKNSEFVKNVPSGIDFKKMSSRTNGNGLYIMSSTKNDTNPIYYYRGYKAEINNNIIFANRCWKIIRTTETGGIKLLYNGSPNSLGGCVSETRTSYTTSYFNSNVTNALYAGYMYNSELTTYTSDEWEAEGKTSEEVNKTNSNLKNSVDNWYSNTIENDKKNLHFGKYLEDTVWCNDRSLLKQGDGAVYYGGNNRLYTTREPTLICKNNLDRFTTKVENGNGALTYPVGLITGDEAIFGGLLAGNESSYNNKLSYLFIGQEYSSSSYEGYWTMTPNRFYKPDPETDVFKITMFGIHNRQGSLANYFVNTSFGVRPSISLKSDIKVYADGIGTAMKPYVVVYDN